MTPSEDGCSPAIMRVNMALRAAVNRASGSSPWRAPPWAASCLARFAQRRPVGFADPGLVKGCQPVGVIGGFLVDVSHVLGQAAAGVCVQIRIRVAEIVDFNRESLREEVDRRLTQGPGRP